MCKVFFFLLRSVGRRDLSAGPEPKKKHHPGCFFFAAAPAKGKGRRSPVGSRHGARAKKKHHPGCFFFAAAPAKGKGRRSPVGSRHGARAKKKHQPGCFFFFAPAPGKGRGRRSPVGRRHGARAKRRCLPLAGAVFFFLLRPRPDRGGVFFLLWPRPDAHSLTVGWGDFGKARVVFFFFLLRPRRVFLENSKKCLGYYIGSKKTRRGHSFPCLSPGPEQKKTPWVVFFFALAPCRLPNGASPSLAFRRGRSKKNTLGGVFFFFCSGPVPASNGASPSLAFRRGRSKKKTPWVVFFFLLRPRADAHSLTAGLGGDASPSPGRCFCFAAAPPGPGCCFLLWPRPDAHSLTVGWGDFGKARVVFFFFLLRPRRVFLENSKKCLGYYIGSKKTRRGHSKKKKTPLPPRHPLK